MSLNGPDFKTPAAEDVLQKTAARMRERNIEVLIVNNGEEARQVALERIPKGAEVHSRKSKTIEDAGIYEALHDPTRYDAVRLHTLKMDRKTQGREIRKLSAAPDYMLGSLHAVTEDGVLVDASATGSQIGPYAGTAGKVILVVGSQKIVPDLETAFRRIHEYALPYEDDRMRKTSNRGSYIGKILIIEREWVDGRMTVILVREPIGI